MQRWSSECRQLMNRYNQVSRKGKPIWILREPTIVSSDPNLGVALMAQFSEDKDEENDAIKHFLLDWRTRGLKKLSWTSLLWAQKLLVCSRTAN